MHVGIACPRRRGKRSRHSRRMRTRNFFVSGKRPMMTTSNGTFSALLALCVGNSPVTGEFPTQRPATRSFDVFFNLCLNKCLSKQLWGWGFETPSRSLWRQCNGELETIYSQVPIKCGLIYHHVTYDTAITVAESESDIRITTDNPYHALTGELWGVYYEDLGKIDCTV